MNDVLLLLHTEADGTLSRSALEAVAAAAQTGPFVVGLIGGSVQGAADAIAGCGAARFVAVDGEPFAQARYATDAMAAEAICRMVSPDCIIAPGTSRWMRALPGVAQRVDAKVDTHVVSMEGTAVRRWYYRNRMEGVLTRENQKWMLLLDGGAAPVWTGAPGAASIERIDVALPAVRTTVLRVEVPQADQQTIRPEAKLLLVAGAGWTKKQKDGQTHAAEASELIGDVLRLAGASLGSSKSLVDMGSEGDAVLPFLTHMHQVGQTGASPRHPKGLATCCHGEEPHVVGWRFIKERRAINLDANCGWARKKADVLYVADAFDVMRELRAILGSKSAVA